MFKTTRALVLREVRYKEADKLLTVLTESEGKLTVKARGAVRRGSRYAAAAQQLCYSELTSYDYGGKWVLSEAEVLEQFLPLRADIRLLALGNYFAELLEAVSDEDCPSPALLQLGLNSLYALSRGLHPEKHVKAAFELRLMCLSGYAPALEGCSRCGRGSPEAPRFYLQGGGLHCAACPPGGAGVSLPLDGAALEALRFVAAADPKRIFSFRLPEDSEKRFSRVCEAYVSAMLEREFGSLEYWKSLE